MYYRTSDDMNGGFGNLTASCREFTLLCAHQDSMVKPWIQKYTEIGPVLDVKTFCPLDKHGIEIQIPSATWMSYDARIPNILQEAMKKPIMETCKKLMRNNRLFNRDLNAVHLMTTFLLTKGNGKTSLPMSTATKMSWNTISQHVLENWYVTNIAVTEKQMEQFIGD